MTTTEPQKSKQIFFRKDVVSVMDNLPEPSLNSPLIDKLVKDVAAIDTSRDMQKSEPNTEQVVRKILVDTVNYCNEHPQPLEGYGLGLEQSAKQAIEALVAQKVAEARIDEWERMHRQYPTAPYIPDFVWKERLAELKAVLHKETTND